MLTVKYEIQVRNTVLEKIKKGILSDKKNYAKLNALGRRMRLPSAFQTF